MSITGIMKDRRIWLWAHRPHQCHFCGFPFESHSEATIDHLIPRSRGGGHGYENVALACRPCNQDKRSMTETEYLVKRVVR